MTIIKLIHDNTTFNYFNSDHFNQMTRTNLSFTKLKIFLYITVRKMLCVNFTQKMTGIKKIYNYPFDPIIKFKRLGCNFSYKVIKEGVYHNKSSLAYTLPFN